ncbi:dipeptidase [Pseudorhodoplanes sp.]|uniref:dipeptidase n=1 Tax=Pseudorhodoplanes sp. TaxID=1934341 RepID=UPI003D0AB020
MSASAIDPLKLHEDAIVIDAVSPLIRTRKYIELCIKGGFTCVAPTIASSQSSNYALKSLADWHRYLDVTPNVILAKTAADIERAKREKKFSVLFHFQGTDPFDDDLNLVEAYRELGVRMVQLAYNVKNRVGDGCTERTDCGLSDFGVRLIQRLNQSRMIVDCTHTGYRTTMEAMEVSTAPVVFSHSNSKSVYKHQRNITDEQAKAAAKTGGLVGVNIVPYFIIPKGRPSMDQFCAHIDHYVKLIGIDHVGIGFDYFDGQQPFASDEKAMAIWRENIETGRWSREGWPEPPHYYPEGLDTPEHMRNLTKALVARGYNSEDTKKILGGNWMRVFRTVFGS